jgi:ferredoxin--NADP+ reductase
MGGYLMPSYDLVVVGGSLSGLSLAIEAREAGLDRVLVLEAGEQVALPEVIGHHALSVEYRAPVTALASGGGGVAIDATRLAASTTVVALAAHQPPMESFSQLPIPDSLKDRVHLGVPSSLLEADHVLVVGWGEEAVEGALRLAGAGVGVVLCIGGFPTDHLSRLAYRVLLRLEAERKATILWKSRPAAIDDVDGFPMVYFDDRRTPDLQFDHVAYCLPPERAELTRLGVVVAGPVAGSTYWLEANPLVAAPAGIQVVEPLAAWDSIRSQHFPELAPSRQLPQRIRGREAIDSLRADHYNATITAFDRAHSDLWVLRVQPDRGDTTHAAGQYATLGLGYWESRVDGAQERNLEQIWGRLIRRSYSISSPVFDDSGYLVDPTQADELEFYIVLVPPSAGRIPALTPRLGLKNPGDRMYLGPKVAGRYTLAAVTDPTAQVVFLATGTGEAPHNAMIVELLRKGHRGPIVSVVSVRYRRDLGYAETHRRTEVFPNFRYLPLATREPGEARRYIQDLVREGELAALLPRGLDPACTHIYACGNPKMIGLPDFDAEGTPTFPAAEGVCQVLLEQGFTLDRRGMQGNVHYEEYW